MNELIFGLAQIFMVIALPTLTIGFCVVIYQRDKAESRVKELEREKPKRKNNEITPAYRWLIPPRFIEVRPVHEWKSEIERKRAMAIYRMQIQLNAQAFQDEIVQHVTRASDSVPDERPIPFNTDKRRK